MILSINIRGFQSHINTTITFDPGLTVITGATDSGKTSIIRAIRWLVFGEPGGESFINKHVGEATVEITTDNQMCISKTRKSNKTFYKISYPNNKEQIFEGATVPDEVKNILGITKQTFGDIETALNFAYQLEPPFLVSQSASVGAKILGKIAGTEVVDLATKSVAKDTYTARQNLAQSSKLIEKLMRDLSKYVDLDILKKECMECQSMLDGVDKYITKKDTLSKLNQHLVLNEDRIVNKAEFLKLFSSIPIVLTKVPEVELNIENLNKCNTLSSNYSQIQNIIQLKNAVLKKLSTISEADKSVRTLEQIVNNHQNLKKLKSLYDDLITKITMNEKKLNKLSELGSSEKLLNNVSANLNLINDLNNCTMLFSQLSKDIEKHHLFLNQSKDLGQANSLKDKVLLDSESLNSLNNLIRRYKEKRADLENKTNLLNSATDNLIKSQSELDEIWKEIKVCPLCDQLIKGDINHGC